MALCNNLAPPFHSSTTLFPSIPLPAIPPSYLTSHLILIPLRTPVCTWKVFLSHLTSSVHYDSFLSLMTKTLPPSPPPVYLHLPTPSSPRPFCESLIDTLQYPAGINLPPSRPQIPQPCWFIGACLQSVSKRGSCGACRLHVDGIDFLIVSLFKIRGPPSQGTSKEREMI